MTFSHRAHSFRLTLLLAGVATLAWQSLAGQSSHRVLSADVEFVKEPGGVALARLRRGTPVMAGARKGSWQEVTVEGWAIGSALRDDKRDGFDLAVNLGVGTPIRAVIGGGATLGLARAGALFDRIEVKSGWVHIRRTGWVPRSALEAARPVVAAAPPPAVTPTKPVAVTPSTPPAATVTVIAGTAFSAQPNGTPVGTLETPLRGDVVERRGGWIRLRFEGWVRDAATGVTSPNGISAADIRAEPDKFVGQTVDWVLQVIGVQKADELRPELPLGQPYVLARGPLPETGFVYLLVVPDEAERFKAMAPLARVQVRATIRAGRTRFLPTPVLTLVRRLD